ncbi:MAG: LPS assembly protein LptD, partial [Thermoanaerobaculia bacterium]|nr:LPS assembly protein LptD [Thermoanaerobaculia bacterium]
MRSAPWALLALLLAAGPAAAQADDPVPLQPPAPAGGAGLELEQVEEGSDDGELPPETEVETSRPDLERIRFQLPFSDASGGGTAVGSAGALEYPRSDFVVASGGIEIAYRQYKIQAERAEVDLATKEVVAEGDVILDEGPRRLAGERLEFNLETKTGRMLEAQAFVDPDIYFEGEEIAKVGENLYTVHHGMMTSCLDETPDWSFRLGRAKVNLDGYARVTHTTMRVKKLPVLYWPYMAWPTERGRKSGFLFPNIGSSRQRGYTLGLAYFQTLGRSYDATLFADLYEEDYLGLGSEFRYHPTLGTHGAATAYFIDDPEVNDTRWKATVDHVSSDLPWGLQGVIRYVGFSDFDFFRDFERDFNNVSLRRVFSTGYLTGNWGLHSANLLVGEDTVFISRNTEVVQRQLPELEYRMRSTQVGSLPLYLQLASSAHAFSAERTGIFDETWQRFEVAPVLSVPLSPSPWLSLSVSAGGRLTWYSDSVDPATRQFSGEQLTRTLPSATAEIVGPSFSKIFNAKIGRFGKFKHIIEPRVNYTFIDDFEEQSQVPLFDELDLLVERNFVTFSIINRLLAKPADENALEGAREIFSFELAQSYSLLDEQPFQISRDRTMETSRGPILGFARFNPGTRVNLEARFSFNTLFDKLNSASFSGFANVGRSATLGATWFTRFDPETGDTSLHQARLFSQLDLVRNRLRLASQVNYDFVAELLQQQRHVLTYLSQCWGMSLEFRELQSINRRDRDIRLSISLKNVG